MTDDEFRDAVAAEVVRATEKWPNTDVPDGHVSGGRKTWMTIAQNWCDRATAEGIVTWRDILDEESAEALAESDPSKLETELIQVATVCLRWIRSLRMRREVAP